MLIFKTKENKFDALTGIDDDLSSRVTKGAIWMTISQVCCRGLGVISSIVLARLLLPSDFGILAIATAVVTMLEGLTTTGFNSALIQKQEKPEEYLDIAWTFELVKHFILFLIVFFFAPILAIFFEEVRTILILRVISFCIIFQGLTNIGIIYFRKRLNFKKIFIYNILPQLTYTIVVISTSFILRNVWALVWSRVIWSLVTCVLSYVMHPYRPNLDFDFSKGKELFNFGKWILGSSIIEIIKNQGTTMFIGKFLGMTELGYFNRSEIFSKGLFEQLTGVIWQVFYPAYSQLQKVSGRLKKAYLLSLQVLTFLGLPMAGGLAIICWDFTNLFLTEKWIMIVPVMQLLCLGAMVSFIVTPARIMFQAVGKPSIVTKMDSLEIMIIALTIFPLSLKWGIVGAAVSFFLSSFLALPLQCYLAISISQCSTGEFVKPVFLAAINTFIMMMIIFFIKEYCFTRIGFLHFFSLIVSGSSIYCIVAYFFDKYFDYGIYKVIKDRIVSLK